MMQFFETLDTKLAAFFKNKFPKKAKGVLSVAGSGAGSSSVPGLQAGDPLTVKEEGDSAPILLLLGSMSGCSYKDAVAYAKGLAEQYITSPELAHYRVVEDKAHRRFVYEIREGGVPFSIIERVIELLDAGQRVRVQLTNGAQTVLEDAHEEVLCLVYPAGAGQVASLGGDDLSDSYVWSVEELATTHPLDEMYPQNRKLVHVSYMMLAGAAGIFMLTGISYTFVSANLVDGDVLFSLVKQGYLPSVEDNPVFQLERAKLKAMESGKTVATLKKDSTGWKWELQE